MPLNTDSIKPRPESLWQWVPEREFKLPPTTIKTSLKSRIAALIGRFKNLNTDKTFPMVDTDNLQLLSEDTMGGIAPQVQWESYANSLEPALGSWCDAPKTKGVIVIHIPHSGNAEILDQWLMERGIPNIEPPSEDEILSADDAWFKQFANIEGIWALPALERCYLRHEKGLPLIRSFFQRLMAGELGHGIIGCDSWAWAFFKRALNLWMPHTFVAQAFDSEALALWFTLLARQTMKHPLVFRQSDNGKRVLSVQPHQNEMKEIRDSIESSPFLKELSIFSRGIPGVALAYWRASLRGEAEKKKIEQKQTEKSPGYQVIWTQPVSSLEITDMPANAGRGHAFVLHSLLLHNGLPESVLDTLLPMPTGQLSQIITELQDFGIIEIIDNRWRLSPLGYPVARQFLADEGYLLDDF